MYKLYIMKVDGPNKINYYSYKNKKIIVIGDIHGDYNGKCDDNNINIIEYLKKIKSNVDIFIEERIPNNKLLNNKINNIDYMSEIINYGKLEYKKNKNKRFHFTDVRYDLNGHELFRGFNILQKYINKNLINIFDEFINNYVNQIYEIFLFIKDNNIKNNIPYYFHKEYIKLKKNNNNIFNKLNPILFNYIDKFIGNYVNIKNDSEINNIYKLGMNAGAAIADFYTISRIMKSNEYNNCILYVGVAHLDIIHDYLININFKNDYNLSSNINNFRCIDNLIDFDEYFRV